ncbi:B3 domain-containing protein Os03g0620400-like isoform X2 [Triticum dicoccoides]|uniref:B3 domain-containing protein Os03g0620400-like isoform X2 n=1 Tax=Triticum dicoccoides TaxID=85692 RepID=UPI00188F0C1E|nr:B3 domain-containing protein Os03g0620400-like isoform X2 [Triticum dicoccoides]
MCVPLQSLDALSISKTGELLLAYPSTSSTTGSGRRRVGAPPRTRAEEGDHRRETQDISKMSDLCECCQIKLKFLRQINGDFMHGLVIPEWFVNQFEGKVWITVKLESPNGNVYDVGVTENMNRTILKSGWASFVDANKIEENYSLMFRYLGNARFKVTIFDSSGKQKASCCARMGTASDVRKPSTFDVDNSSSSLGGTTRSSPSERSDSDESQKESSYGYKKSAKKAAISDSSEELSAEDSLSRDNLVESYDVRVHLNDYVLSGKCDLTVAQEAKIQALVEKIRSEIPVLVVQMKKTSANFGNLIIRKEYALKYFPCEATNIILQLPRKNKEWKCRFNPGRRNLYLGYFVHDNCVQEGDICLFQPIAKVKEGRFTIIVHLLHKESVRRSPGGTAGMTHMATDRRTSANTSLTARVKEEPATDDISSLGPEEDVDNSEGASETLFVLPERASITPAQEQKVREKVETIESTVPVYVAILNKCNVSRKYGIMITMGKQYASRYLEKQYFTGHRGKKNVISLVLQREGKSRTWDTELRRASDRMRICKGWVAFVRGNRLRVGDICLFKLMESELLKMIVYIIRREKCLD